MKCSKLFIILFLSLSHSLLAFEDISENNTSKNTPKSSIYVDELFDFEMYDKNFILPLSYDKTKPFRYESSAYKPVNTYNSNFESIIQFSVKKLISYNLFGLDEQFYFAYTQKVWWQIYINSSPFREINYKPELYILISSSENTLKSYNLKSMQYGLVHESNGQEGYQSRSWNRAYIQGHFQVSNFQISPRIWYHFFKGSEQRTDTHVGDDNVDIEKYLGYGDLKIDYVYGKSQMGVLLRNNFRLHENKGAIEFNYSYPAFGRKNTFFYIEAFNGYGQNLIDYNREVTKVSLGFSFSRGLF